MPDLKAIRRRIESVKNTEQITRAMKLVAAARLRRAQEAIESLRPYAYRLRDMIRNLALRTEEEHPLLAVREPEKVMLLILTSDRGLCGAFNANICRRAELYVAETEDIHQEVSLAIIGKKGREYFRRRKVPIRREHMEVLANVHIDRAIEIGSTMIEDYEKLELDAIYLVYNEFKSAMTQRVTVERLLPIPTEELAKELGFSAGVATDYIYEPSVEDLLDRLLPMYLQMQVYRALLESVASEMGARMTAMDSATNNAVEMIAKLTLQYNRARQAAITTEIIEVVSGAEAL